MPTIWLLAGLPRSGTSLCCCLADALPDTVALIQPLASRFDGFKPPQAAREVRRDLATLRQRLLAERRAPTVLVEGALGDNVVGDAKDDAGLRRKLGESKAVALTRTLSPNYTLFVKHNALFAALAPWLKLAREGTDGADLEYRCVGLVRNPLAVLASWQTVALPIQEGRLPGGEPFAADLRRALASAPDVPRRQLAIVNWFFATYAAHFQPEDMLRYETLVETNGASLASLLARTPPGRPLDSCNANAAYAGVAVEELADLLISDGGAWTEFYSVADVEAAARGLRRSTLNPARRSAVPAYPASGR
jgi:hypothetical protein